MNVKRVLLASTGLIAAGFVTADVARADGHTAAANIVPGGGLSLEISGFAQLDFNFGDENSANGRSVSMDTDGGFVIFGSATDDSTGVRYGAQLDLELDGTNQVDFDEAWVFFEGDFGEFRFGGEDGPADAYKIGAHNFAAGTGGIDGSIQGVASRIGIEESGDSSKIRFDSPVVGGFQVGLSYSAQTGDEGREVGNENVAGAFSNVVEIGATYTVTVSGLDLELGAVAAFGEAEAAGEDDLSGFQIGAQTEVAGFTIGGGYGTTQGGTVDEDFFTVGAAATFGAVNASIGLGVQDVDGGDTPLQLVVSADTALMPGVFLGGDLGFADFDNDTGAPNGEDDTTFGGVARIKVSF